MKIQWKVIGATILTTLLPPLASLSSPGLSFSSSLDIPFYDEFLGNEKTDTRFRRSSPDRSVMKSVPLNAGGEDSDLHGGLRYDK